uniref:Interferon regulatory factor like protein n=1 Tax=Phallusia mammillata TaxID=59560 RepID=A0A6F9DG71_9ASCI|nr:interferon regulatory factor like protein [Phallusia mammillata]
MDTQQFKPWLIKQISSGQFKDLEWIDDEKKRVFKLPWTKKNYPNWEAHHEIFRAWAEHRAQIKKEPESLNQHISLMKSNFRTIINKCQEIEEQTNLHQLGLQTGNYKVYKILEPEEARMKREQVKNFLTEIDHSEDIVEITSSTGEMLDINLIGGPPNISEDWIKASGNLGVALLHQQPESRTPSPPPVQPPKPKRKRFHQPDLDDPYFSPKEVIFVKGDNSSPVEMEAIETTLITPNTGNDETEMIDLNVDNAAGFQILLDAAEIAAEGQSDIEDIRQKSDELKLTALRKVMDLYNIPEEDLYAYELIVKYEQNEVLREIIPDMREGCRIHYGDHDTQRLMVRIDEPKRTQLEIDFDRPAVSLPKVAGPVSEQFGRVLHNTDAGVVLRLEQDCTLWAKRLCQSRVFAFTNYGENADPSSAMQMAREEEVPLFSYVKFFEAWLPYAKRVSNTMPEHCVQMAFGKKPRQRNSKVYITANLMPRVAAKLMDLADLSDERMNSDATSLDDIIRTFSPDYNVLVE